MVRPKNFSSDFALVPPIICENGVIQHHRCKIQQILSPRYSFRILGCNICLLSGGAKELIKNIRFTGGLRTRSLKWPMGSDFRAATICGKSEVLHTKLVLSWTMHLYTKASQIDCFLLSKPLFRVIQKIGSKRIRRLLVAFR